MLEFLGSIINMDDPRHAKQRKIVARGFTPRVLEELKHDVERAAVEIVDEIIDKGECDFVTDVAALLPLRIILDLLGIPRSEEKFIFDRTNIILGLGDEEYVPNQDPMAVMGSLFQAGQDLTGMVAELGAERRKNPGNDIISLLVNAQDEGDGVLTDAELGSFFVLLVVAGNETTRNAIAHGLHWMSQNPEQKDWWWDDFDARAPQAVEEIVRYATPGHPLPPHLHHRRHDARRPRVQRGRQGRALVQRRQPRPRRVPRPAPLRPLPAAGSDQGPRRLRRPRPALLPRRPPGPAGDHAHVPRAAASASPTSTPSASPTASSRTSSTASST